MSTNGSVTFWRFIMVEISLNVKRTFSGQTLTHFCQRKWLPGAGKNKDSDQIFSLKLGIFNGYKILLNPQLYLNETSGVVVSFIGDSLSGLLLLLDEFKLNLLGNRLLVGGVLINVFRFPSI